MARGKPFPVARETALKDYLLSNPDRFSFSPGELLEILTEPNNILAIEYLKSLENIKSAIHPFTIKRLGSGYHEKELEKLLPVPQPSGNWYIRVNWKKLKPISRKIHTRIINKAIEAGDSSC